MIITYLTSQFKLCRLHNSWIIQTDDLSEALSKLQEFIKDNLLTGNILLQDNQDYRIIKKEQNTKSISIDQLRELQSFLYQTPIFAKYKVAIIYQADSMNLNTANSCLKILEDTPKNSYVFLITARAGSIIPTIRSRCNFLNFSINQIKENPNYSRFISLITSTKFEEKLFVLKELSEKNRELFIDFSDSIMQLLIKLIKKASNVSVNLNSVEKEIFDNLKLKSTSHLIQKFENIKKLSDNTIVYDLDLKASFILFLEEFKK